MLKDDLNVGLLPRWPLARIENKLIWVREPSSLLAFVERKKQSKDMQVWQVFEKENPKLISFANSITPDDNPYLVVTEIGF